VRLWSLQAVIVALMLLVGVAVVNAPQARKKPSSVTKLCESRDELAREACAEFSGG
jgi:hypothetical protein